MFQTSFGPLEKALALAFDVPESVRTSGFRSWITNLQKLGVLGEKARVGRGAPLTYGPDEIHRLFLGLELSECGLSPTATVALIDAFWESKFKACFKQAEAAVEKESEDIVLILGGVSLRSGTWSASKKGRFAGVPTIGSVRLSALEDYTRPWMQQNAPIGLPQRMIVIDLTARLRRFHAIFAKTFLDDALTERSSKKPSQR